MSQSTWKNILLAAPILLWLGCATTASREPVEPAAKSPRPGVEEQRDHQVIAILHQLPPTLWRREMAELAGAYDLEVVLAWEVPSLEAPCVIFEAPRHLSVEELAESLGRDHRVELAEPIRFFRVLEGALATTGKGITQTVRRGLELVSAGRAYEELRRLRGKVRLGIELDALRADR